MKNVTKTMFSVNLYVHLGQFLEVKGGVPPLVHFSKNRDSDFFYIFKCGAEILWENRQSPLQFDREKNNLSNGRLNNEIRSFFTILWPKKKPYVHH